MITSRIINNVSSPLARIRAYRTRMVRPVGPTCRFSAVAHFSAGMVILGYFTAGVVVLTLLLTASPAMADSQPDDAVGRGNDVENAMIGRGRNVRDSLRRSASSADADHLFSAHATNNTDNNTNPSTNAHLHHPPGPSLAQTLLALTVVLLLIVGGTWLLRRINPNSRQTHGHNHSMELLARMPIGPRQSLCLVRFANRLVLLGQGPQTMTSLDVITDPDQVARILGQFAANSTGSITQSFQRLFQKESETYQALTPEQKNPNHTNDDDTTDPDTLKTTGDPAGSVLTSHCPAEPASDQAIPALLEKVKTMNRAMTEQNSPSVK